MIVIRHESMILFPFIVLTPILRQLNRPITLILLLLIIIIPIPPIKPPLIPSILLLPAHRPFQKLIKLPFNGFNDRLLDSFRRMGVGLWVVVYVDDLVGLMAGGVVGEVGGFVGGGGGLGLEGDASCH